jgi:hypothetical protein
MPTAMVVRSPIHYSEEKSGDKAQQHRKFGMTDAPKIVSEYEAAALVAMSPDLLRWLTSYAPKAKITTKLKVAKKDGERYFYDREELLAFDAFLRQP